MLNFGNKEFRNLQEQVLKNAQDIETLKGRESLHIVIVNELPEVGNPSYIYLVAKDDGESPDVYDEYIWLEDEERYELIGGVSIDLTNYVTTDTEQTISGAKTFSSDVTTTGKVVVGASGYNIKKDGSNMVIEADGNPLKAKGDWLPNSNNTYGLGNSSLYWKNLYVSGNYYLGNDKYIYLDSSNRVVISNNADRLKIDSTGNVWFVANAIPLVTNTYNLGSESNYWKNLYLTGYITNGVNTVSVANIASKVTSTFISGTFDSNGESTIDTEQAGTPEGLFIFAYGNCQCFLRLTATMVNSADVTPIRIACPMIYNSAAVNGWLNITKSGYILILKVTDGTNHVDSGYVWTLTKTNLI